jgi:hypothetical protein
MYYAKRPLPQQLEHFRRPIGGTSSRFPIILLTLSGIVLLLIISISLLPSLNRSYTRSRARSVSPRSDLRLLVMTSSNCNEFDVKPWIKDAHRFGYLYSLVVFDYSIENKCKDKIAENENTLLIHSPRTYKWPAVHRLLTDTSEYSKTTTRLTMGPHLLEQYDYFFFSDDDIDVPGDAKGLVRLMQYCHKAGLKICQPSLSNRSAFNMDITVFTEGLHTARSTGFVEQMAPLFSQDAARLFSPYFRDLTHGWGIDALWSEYASDNRGINVGVVDAIQIDHMRPSGVSALYKRVGGIEKAEIEREEFKRRYNLKDAVFERMKTGNRGAGQKIFSMNSID